MSLFDLTTILVGLAGAILLAIGLPLTYHLAQDGEVLGLVSSVLLLVVGTMLAFVSVDMARDVYPRGSQGDGDDD